MTGLLFVYVTCESVEQAKSIGKQLMEKRLCACVNIFPEMQALVLWPPKSGRIDESHEVVLIAKTIEEKYTELEEEVSTIHSYDVPCIMAIPVKHVNKKYYEWLIGEMEIS
jgi:periplasmic divalent cation tolerance protein